ncbi:hypothetical protein PRIPAC_71342, partial [Pristionchus pacificus]|uniref:Uncharacterized protein n=1 Tax=Pristionchus pacificus TaxID=54126 RepID=A0A2A6C794_PRIPA
IFIALFHVLFSPSPPPPSPPSLILLIRTRSLWSGEHSSPVPVPSALISRRVCSLAPPCLVIFDLWMIHVLSEEQTRQTDRGYGESKLGTRNANAKEGCRFFCPFAKEDRLGARCKEDYPKGPEQHHQTASHVEPDSSNKEKTCIEDKSDAMQISLYKAKKKDAGSDSGGHVSKPPVEEKQDSPEVFENNAQVVSLNPINVTQIFVDSVIPQTNVSKQHTDIVDQNTLETVQNTYMDDMVYDRLDSSEEQFPEVPQPRPRANVLQPEDDTIVDNTMSERATKPSEKRATRNAAPRTASSGIPSEKRAMRTAARATVFPEHPTTPDRIPSVFTPQPPTKSEKVVYTTGKRLSRGPISTRTAAISRPRPSGARTPPAADHVNVDNTCPSHEPLTNRAHRHTGPQTAKVRRRDCVKWREWPGPARLPTDGFLISGCSGHRVRPYDDGADGDAHRPGGEHDHRKSGAVRQHCDGEEDCAAGPADGRDECDIHCTLQGPLSPFSLSRGRAKKKPIESDCTSTDKLSMILSLVVHQP